MGGLTQAGAIAYVQQGLSFRSDLASQITTMFDLVQYDELETGDDLPYFLQMEDQTLNGTANVATLTIPAGTRPFIRPIDDGALAFTTSNGPVRFLSHRAYDWIIGFKQDDSDGTIPSGDPFYYAIRAFTFYCVPIPTAAWTVSATYYAHDTAFSTLASGGQNNWLQYAPGVLTNLVGLRMAEDTHNDEAVVKFQRRYTACRARLLAEIANRDGADREYVMGNQS